MLHFKSLGHETYCEVRLDCDIVIFKKIKDKKFI